MIFEYLITYHHTDDSEVVEVIRETLAKVLEDNLNEFDSEAVERMVIPRVRRFCDYVTGEDGGDNHRALFGFALDLPEETASPRTVVDEFSEALDTNPIVHLVKFDDPLIRKDLAVWSKEIYSLEMKLRRVLTIIYLHAYRGVDPYELLREELVQPINKKQLNPEHMKERNENQFFHLTFSQYIELNQRPKLKLQDLLDLVRNKEAYEEFRDELSRNPIEDEDDTELLSGLKDRMEAIEAMRNCCAHSRRPSQKVIENYENVRPLLEQLLDDYLARWEWQGQIEETLWDKYAREAVEQALENADWNEGERTVTFYDADDDRMHRTVDSREELEQHLCEIANTAFYANAPRMDNEFIYDCDDRGIVWTALTQYEKQLEDLFGSDD